MYYIRSMCGMGDLGFPRVLLTIILTFQNKYDAVSLFSPVY